MAKTSSRLLRLLRYLGLFLLIGLLFHAGPRKLFEALRHARPMWLLLAWALNFPQLGIKAYRWYLLVRWQQIRLSYPRALLSYFGSLLVGFLTPGRLGEMAKALTLKYECNVSLARGLSSVVLDRVFDMCLLLPLGALGIFRFAIIGAVLPWPTFIILCLMFAIPPFFLHETTARWAGARAAALPLLSKRADWVRLKVDQFAEGLAVMTLGRALLCCGLTLASYGIFFFQCLLCAWALGFTLPFLDLIWLMAATNLMSFIPISVSGLGTREACLAYFLARATPPQPAPVAIMFGLTIFLVFFVGGGLIGFGCWQWAPIGLKQAAHDARRRHGAKQPVSGSDGSV